MCNLRRPVQLAEATTRQPVRMHLGDARMHAQPGDVGLRHMRLRGGVIAPVDEGLRKRTDLRQQRLQLLLAQRPGWQQRARPQACRQCVDVAAHAGVEYRLLQSLAHPAAGRRHQWFCVIGALVDFRQAQLQTLAQEGVGRIAKETPQRIQGQFAVVAIQRRQRRLDPARQWRACAATTARRRMPGAEIAETTRIGIVLDTERFRRERLQRMPQHQRAARSSRVGVVLAKHVEQFRDQHRRLAHAAIARVGAEPAQIEHLTGGGEQLQEQEAIVLAQRAVAGAARGAAQLLGEAVETAGRIAARVIAVVHAEHADHPERQQPQRHHPPEADAAGEQRRARVGGGEQGLEMRADHVRRHRLLDSGAGRGLRQLFDRGAQPLQRTCVGGIARVFRQQGIEQTEQTLAPLRRWHRLAEQALVARQRAQQPQQCIERIERTAFEVFPRRDAGNVLVAAAGVAEQQAVEGEAPGIGIVGRSAVATTMRRIYAPVRTGLAQPVTQALQRRCVETGGIGQRRRGQQVEHLVQAEARDRQRQQTQEHFRQRLGGQPRELLAEERDDPWGGGGDWHPTVGDCVRVILEEEWAHLRYVRRDLALLREST